MSKDDCFNLLRSNDIPASRDEFVVFWTEVYKYFMIVADMSQGARI